MARMYSVRLLLILNTIIFIMSICFICFSLYLRYASGATECGRFLQIPFLAFAGFVLLLSVVGIAGGCFSSTFLMVGYLVLTVVLILALACFTIFVFILTSQGAGEAITIRGDNNSWLDKRVQNYKTWKGIKSCLQEAKICRSVYHQTHKPHNLSPIQSGCCQPPPGCSKSLSKTILKTPTILILAAAASSRASSDCSSWKNDESILCYDCQSCKAGFSDSIKDNWKKIAIANTAILGFHIIILAVGCCAVSSIRAQRKKTPSKPSS